MSLNILVTVLIVGGLILLSFLHLSNVTGVNRRANLLFGIFTLQWSSFWLDEMIFPDALDQNGLVFILVRLFQFLSPVSFLLSVKFYSNPNSRITWRSGVLLIVPLLFLPLLLSKAYLDPDYFQLFYIALFLGHALFYTILAYFKIIKHQRTIELIHSNLEDIDLRWIKYIIYSFIGSALLSGAYNVFTGAESLNVYINLFFLGVVYLVAFYSVRQKEIYPKGIILTEVVADHEQAADRLHVTKPKLIDDAQLAILKQRLITLMEKEKPYLDSELNLVKLADQIQISTHQLSYLINTGFGENFFTFINRYRVKKASELLRNPAYDHFNILVIGHESGFNSKTSFNTTFKKITNSTPTEFRQSQKR